MWLLVGIIVVRFIALPLLGILVIKTARNFGMLGSDPLYHFVLLLQYSVPPAMAIGMSYSTISNFGPRSSAQIFFYLLPKNDRIC